jgi:hypothetical protein
MIDDNDRKRHPEDYFSDIEKNAELVRQAWSIQPIHRQSRFEYHNEGIIGSWVAPSGAIFYVPKEVGNAEANYVAVTSCNSLWCQDVFSAFPVIHEELPELARQICIDFLSGKYDDHYGYIFFQLEMER